MCHPFRQVVTHYLRLRQATHRPLSNLYGQVQAVPRPAARMTTSKPTAATETVELPHGLIAIVYLRGGQEDKQ
jgi:hypothetical protein